MKGIALDELGRYEEAIVCYDEALNLDPKDVVSLREKDIALHKLGRDE